MNVKRLVGLQAMRAHSQIDSMLAGTAWFVTVETRVCDAVGVRDDEDVPKELQSMYSRGRFDFLIATREQGVPKLVIELDAHPAHGGDEGISRDERKDRVCLRAGLPILRIDLEHLEVKEKATILEWIVGEFIHFQTEFPRLLEKIRRETPDRLVGTKWDTVRGEGAIQWIDRRRRFPAIDRVHERLLRRFDVREIDQYTDFFEVEGLGARAWPDALNLNEVVGEVIRDGEVLHQVVVSLPSHPRLEFCEDGLLTDRGVAYCEMSYSLYGAVGWEHVELSEQIARWKALRELERWAEKALVLAHV